jgi:hypothetical protein
MTVEPLLSPTAVTSAVASWGRDYGRKVDTITRRPARRRATSARQTAAEIEVAIALVTRGAAVTVRLSGLPGAARLAATAADQARAAGVGFQVERDRTGIVLRVGPRVPG